MIDVSGTTSDGASVTAPGAARRGRDDRFMPSRRRAHAPAGAPRDPASHPDPPTDAGVDPGLVAASSPVGLVVVDPWWRCRWANRTAAELVGREPADVVGMRWTDFATEKDVVPLVAALESVGAAGARVGHAISPLFALDKAVELTIEPFAAPGDPTERLFVVALEDVSDRRRIERDLASQAGHDPLTGLANRATILDHLDAAMRSARGSDAVVVAFVDLDGFKPVNETLGHAVGDQLLAAVARRLRHAATSRELIGRVGGDEFVACSGPGPADPRGLGHRILRTLQDPIPVRDGLEVRVGASIGLAVVGADDETRADDVLRRADAAMYSVKRRGGGAFEVFGPTHAALLSASENWEAELRQAIDTRRIRPYYQPIVATTSGRVVGVEALVRWHHEANGVMYPEEFLEPAASIGAHGDLTALVVDAALRQAATWRAGLGSASPTVSVNLGPADLADPGLPARLGATVDASGLGSDALGVEISEAVVDRDVARAVAFIRDLRERDIHVTLDDFGSAHSVLGRLGHLPVQSLKLDCSLIAALGSTDESLRRRTEVLLRSLVELAHGLDMSVVAEGVERHEELAVLVEMGCDMTQGFVHGPPVPADELDLVEGATIRPPIVGGRPPG